tara:strand:- start:113 stop:325 length:213 start_codon:yes stop_codon:yes gene_type:complete
MSNSPKNQQPSIKETRARLLKEIKHQLQFLNDHAGEDNPLMIIGSSSAVLSLLEAYLYTLPATYRGDNPQ